MGAVGARVNRDGRTRLPGSMPGTRIAARMGVHFPSSLTLECMIMPRNTLKSFPTGMLRRGLAHVHPASIAVVQPPIDSPPEPPGNAPTVSTIMPPQVSGPMPSVPVVHTVAPEANSVVKVPTAEALTLLSLG